ncbi:membrane protein insertion efficiency factor YidD [Kocuria rhizophila]|uniref:membrane protein insertion efficiency factor YidD n=1 Tax=Kocuria TaxID=57493 RepID=UPI000AB398BA|nr:MULTISPECIES: membrane protein insertion efficiency factor YidD [Kocuria]WIW67505.1 membrane protein insertion efficiency factor YidD [Kocuria sp. ChxB]MCG7425317.1 membrane protein insertion efficiency factor YidD [Kocuria rhizophila]MCT1457374.1 membrane protein insertion efficiency factor YidD [Kocuria rhizophila]MCT1545831.1 membrane protein insertion efficiency factor YidD [Kocuria rhizophila]MCT2172345.1 membrane protein insertion efficiency factor YidD [Kocuria rhizophila]
MTPRVTPEQLLARAPHEFNTSGGVLGAVKQAPQNLLIALLKLYRTIVSPLYGDVCRYFPSCSAYALEAVTVHGAVRGLGLSVMRLLRCHPWAAGGIDRIPGGGREFPTLATTPRIVLLNHPNLVREYTHDCQARHHAAQGANAR